MRHILSIQLQNEAGALTRVASLFARRGYNIESLSVAPTDNPQVSRLTLVTEGNDHIIEQITKQVSKLVDVIHAVDMTKGEHVERELLVLKFGVKDGHLQSIHEIITNAQAKVLDDDPDFFIVEQADTSPKIDQLIHAISQHGEIKAVVRSGAMAVARGALVMPHA